MITVKRSLRVYADTSVFGGCFDNEFKTESVRRRRMGSEMLTWKRQS
jgi:hypothetical protein